MFFHIVAMNLAAPISAMVVAQWVVGQNHLDRVRRLLWPATVAQVLLLWAWHAPISNASSHQQMQHIGMLASLCAVATAFWLAVVASFGRSAWQAILALLVTGKLVCLLGTLLVFAPQYLYSIHADVASSNLSIIADQQLAGLLMIAACPLSYVLSGVVQSMQMVQILDRHSSVDRAVPSSRCHP
jgi:putative membrane protein